MRYTIVETNSLTVGGPTHPRPLKGNILAYTLLWGNGGALVVGGVVGGYSLDYEPNVTTRVAPPPPPLPELLSSRVRIVSMSLL